MDHYTTDELRAMYRDLDQKSRTPVFGQEDAITLMIVCTELGSRGYQLNADESDWIAKDHPGVWQAEDQT